MTSNDITKGLIAGIAPGVLMGIVHFSVYPDAPGTDWLGCLGMWAVVGVATHTSTLVRPIVLRAFLWALLVGVVNAGDAATLGHSDLVLPIFGFNAVFGLLAGGSSYAVERLLGPAAPKEAVAQ